MSLYKEKYLTFFKVIKSIFLTNWKFLVSFTLLYIAMGQVFILPFLRDVINFSLSKAGYEFLNTTILFDWITKPFTLPSILVCIVMLSFYLMLEMSTFIIYITTVQRNINLNWKKCLSESIKRSSRILIPRNWILLILILLVFPFTFLSFNFSIIFRLNIPEFILDFIQENTLLSILYFVIIIVFNILSFILIFSMPAFIIDAQTFKESIKTSLKLIRNHIKYIISRYVSGMIIVLILTGLVFAVCLGLILIIVKLTQTPLNAANVFLDIYMIFKMYTIFFFDIIMIIFNFLFITVIYINLTNNTFNIFNIKKKSKAPIKERVLTIILILIALFTIGIYLDYSSSTIYLNKSDESNKIVAHRAGAIWGPENTLIALDKAIEDKASEAEIDVQQTKDGKLVILHDTNLKRVSGVSKNIWDLTYDEIKNLDVGSHFSPNYKDARIPTLGQMIEKANGKIKLMIEIKKTSHNKNIERQVINEIKSHNFENQCSIASMNLDTLKIVKSIDPKIRTVYITPGIYGNYYSLNYVDAFSIEASFVNRETVILSHKNNKKIYVWTVNKENNLSKALNLNVDGIVTDNPILANYLKDLGSKDLIIENLLNNFFNIQPKNR